MNKNLFGIMFPLFFILAATRSIEQIKWISYSAPVFFLYFLLIGLKEIKSKEIKLSLIIASLFGLWAIITSLWSPYPKETFIRSIFFVVSSWSLLLAGYCWANQRKNELGFLIPLNVTLIIASVFSLMTKIPFDYWAGYGFGLKSFWGHQNTLGSLIILTIPGIFMLPLNNKKIRIITAVIFSFLNVYILIQTHSRTSLVVLILSALLFVLLTMRIKVLLIILLTTACITTFYFLNNDFHSTINNYLFKTETSLLDRKKPILIATYEAAGNGGWKGLGFGVSDNTVIKDLLVNITYHFEGVRLVREKGVSLFAVIEETGWVGLVLFLLFVGYIFYLSILTFWKTLDWTAALMICVLIGMCLHAQLEGWWLGVGSVQFPLFMGLLGIIIGKSKIDQLKTDQPRVNKI